jgi:hypothetical protein
LHTFWNKWVVIFLIPLFKMFTVCIVLDQERGEWEVFQSYDHQITFFEWIIFQLKISLMAYCILIFFFFQNTLL